LKNNKLSNQNIAKNSKKINDFIQLKLKELKYLNTPNRNIETKNFFQQYSNTISSIPSDGKTQRIFAYSDKNNYNILTMPKEENYFYYDGLLLSSREDIDKFYINEKIINYEEDKSLKYSKNLRNYSEKDGNRILMNQLKENELNATEILRDCKIGKKLYRKTLIEKNEQDLIKLKKNNQKKMNEISKIQNYNKSIVNLLQKIKQPKFSSKELVLSDLDDYNSLKTTFNLNETKKIKLERSPISSPKIKSARENLENFFKNDSLKNDIYKVLKKKNILKKAIKEKYAINLENIYNDLVKTKNIIMDYTKNKENKFQILYNKFNNKKNNILLKNEYENEKLKKTDYNLFWAIHNMN
jgi:hypothetical protein